MRSFGAAFSRRRHFADRRECRHGVRRRCRGIAQQHGEALRRRIEDGVVGFRRFVQRKLVGDQRAHIDASRGDEAQELLHIAVLGPAHVGQGIIAPLFLVGRIVAARAVGARHVQLDFLEVHVVPGELHAHCADDADAPAVAAEAEGVLRRRRRFRGGRDDRAIHAASVGEPAHRFQGRTHPQSRDRRRVRAPCPRACRSDRCPPPRRPAGAPVAPPTVPPGRARSPPRRRPVRCAPCAPRSSRCCPAWRSRRARTATPSGIRAARLRPTRMVSPWPVPSPPYATRSPISRSVTVAWRAATTPGA